MKKNCYPVKCALFSSSRQRNIEFGCNFPQLMDVALGVDNDKTEPFLSRECAVNGHFEIQAKQGKVQFCCFLLQRLPDLGELVDALLRIEGTIAGYDEIGRLHFDGKIEKHFGDAFRKRVGITVGRFNIAVEQGGDIAGFGDMIGYLAGGPAGDFGGLIERVCIEGFDDTDKRIGCFF